MLYGKQLGLLWGISHSPGCCCYVKSLLFSFCLYMIKSDDAPTEIQFSKPGEMVMQMLMYQFKLTCFYHVVMNMCLVWRNGTDFI